MSKKQAVTDPTGWVDEFGDYLYRYALLRLGNPVVAQDAVQETFLAALKSLNSFDGRVPVKYWLRGILRNKTVDHFRKTAREETIEKSDDPDYVDTLLFRLAGIAERRPTPLGFDPYIDLDKKEFWDVLETCLAKLSGNARRAFTLKAIDGMPSEDVCKVLGITANNLWVLTHRAREQLKACLRVNWLETGDC